MRFSLKIDIDAVKDIKDASSWYEEQQKGLGKRYSTQVAVQINELIKDPLLYRIRYNEVYCLKINKFPFMIHYKVVENVITIFAVIHTSRNPKIWEKRSR